MNPQPPHRQKSQRLVTTTPETIVAAALLSFKPQIPVELFSGISMRKISSKGSLVPRLLTFSDDLFTLFVSHHKVGKTESKLDRARYRGYKSYKRVVEAVTGQPVQTNHDIRVIDVADIIFVASGYVASRKVEACKDPDLDPARVISVFHNNGNTMDFMVEDEAWRDKAVEAIKVVREAYAASKFRVGREECLIRYAWYDTDYDKSGMMEQSEFLQLLGRVNIYIKQERAIKIFNTFIAAKLPRKGGRIGGPKDKGITYDECLYILRKLNSELNDETGEISDVLFDEIFGKGKRAATAEDFVKKFLRGRQNDNRATIEEVRELFSELNGMELSGTTRRVGEDGTPDDYAIDRTAWREYLMSKKNDLYCPEKRRLDESMLDKPLTAYWINSSHNTYLTGDQLKSLSSVEMYVVAMHRGCKCLELDCWDGDDGCSPVVYHGYTLTSKIPFQSIITCVKGYVEAHPDTLPIILSLENHCSNPFQEMMADILNNTLGGRLYKLPESSDGPLPSPLDLVGKVVVKGKRPQEYDDDDLTEAESLEVIGEKPGTLREEQAIASLKKRDKLREKMASREENRKRDKLKENIASRDEKNGYAPLPPEALLNIVRQLSDLTLFNGEKLKDFKTSIGLPRTDMHSFSESKLAKLYTDPANLQQWKEYNVGHMSRIYPAGARIDSSNYNPVVPWSSGCQLVALNFQTDDSPMTVNDGRFRENGCCGYVLKPPSVFPTYKESDSGAKVLRIKVLSGSCLPKPYGESAGEVIDPYVIIRLHDVVKSETMRKSMLASADDPGHDDSLEITERKTSPVRDNGYCPQWKDAEYFSFTVNSDVAVVEFIVMDNDRGFIDELMCKTAVPVSCLRQGLRCVQFYDQCSSQHGPFGMARILLDVDISYVV
eukprot:CAMPEP_0172537354 /NCGR_PEP_ID=MMETSP1067-20121228/8965_1 /TAXON_ID=265564 ORGANISM="Thalassiosira punctigera, Strain Tpunct2005C2" /NCGR_SAMPLE_ID=MMETSP1067 /ASSEMBLY_ACC=CAM_ASM_000444 /LENGTH=888 /DNA_ID=CAMNT_0013322641 /DNA_START=13 /DNA_END=2679 /DNA_ORIENTATION=+